MRVSPKEILCVRRILWLMLGRSFYIVRVLGASFVDEKLNELCEALKHVVLVLNENN